MTDGDAITAVIFDDVLLRQARLDAPAEEEADVVAVQPIAADDRPLRAGAGMQTQPGVVVAVAVFHHDVVADLPTDAVAVVVAGRHLAHGDAIAILQEDAAGVVAVEVVVVIAIAVQREVLDDDVGDVLAAKDRKEGRQRSPRP